MAFDPGTIAVTSIIAHKIPHRLKSDPLIDIPLSAAAPPVPPETLGFFRGRLIRTLASRGQAVEEDTNRSDRVLPPLSMQKLLGGSDLVAFSQAAAKHLYTSQGGASSTGLLVVCEIVLGGVPSFALMKLEEEQGVVVEDVTVNGVPTLSITVEDHLLLTDNTRVFKAAVFWMDASNLLGYVSDEQQGDRVDIADYFLGEFLGCRLISNPAAVTKTFHDTVSRFISEQVADGDDKLSYRYALHTEVASNRTRVDPVQFVADNFETAHRQPLLDALVSAGVPAQAFRKDVSRLGKWPGRSQLRTTSGITIAGTSSEIGDRVKSEVVEGESVIVVHDTITDVK